MKLYRFEKCEAKRIKTIGEGKLWLSKPNQFNDLYDSRLSGIAHFDLDKSEYQSVMDAFDLVQNVAALKSPFDENMVQELKNYMDIESKPNALSKALHNSAFVSKLRTLLQAHFGICCFFSGEITSHPLMWAHYAANHKGFCVEYEYVHVQGETSMVYEVIYASKLPEISTFEWLFSANKATTSVLTTKDIIWNYEKEWRLIIGGAKGEVNLPVYIKPNKIISGNRCNSEDKKELERLARDLGVDFTTYMI
jgi:hypothetical protein